MDGPLPEGLDRIWKEFFEAHGATPQPRSSADPAIFDHPVLFPLQRAREMTAMLNVRIRNPMNVLDIGSDKGGGLYHWCCLPGVRKVVSIEIRGTPYADAFREAFPHISFLFIPESSYAPDTVEKVRIFLGNGFTPIDVAFLDGDKANYFADYSAYLPLMRRPGVMLLHDVQDEITPKRVFEVLGQSHRTRVILDGLEGEQALDRKAGGEPPRTCHEGWLFEWGPASCGVGVVEIE